MTISFPLSRPKTVFGFLCVLLTACCNAQLPVQRNFPIVKCSAIPSKYEQILMTQLRDIQSSQEEFRSAADKLIEILVTKAVECLPTQSVSITTPVDNCSGITLDCSLELVSVMRSGCIPLTRFSNHFPHAAINKILIQRDEETARPHFKYMKLSSTLSRAQKVIITEPMIATGETLHMVIELLKKEGVEVKNIIIAALCASPEGLARLTELYPEISVVLTVIDNHLNEKKYISPGIGDFGDRYFGT